MKKCRAIIHEINFEPQHIAPCCNVHATKVPLSPYSGGDFNASAYKKFIHTSLENLQKDDALCKGCDRLEDLPNLSIEEGMAYTSKQLSSNFITNVSINHFRNLCNCRCIYCSFWKGKQEEPYKILPSFKSMHEANILAEHCIFSWGGGEPTILKEFEEAFRWIMDNNYFQKIHTNAMKQSPSIARALKQGMCNVDISIDAGCAETHKKVKGLNIWTQVLENVKIYRENASHFNRISIKYIVFEENNSMEDIQGFLHICENFDLKNIEISLNFLEINAGTVSDKTLESARYLYKESQKRGFVCTPFFIPEPFLSQIIAGVHIVPFGKLSKKNLIKFCQVLKACMKRIF